MKSRNTWEKTSENNNEHELKDVPHHFCTSPDGMKIAFLENLIGVY